MTMAALDAKNSELALLSRRNAALHAACVACLDMLDEAMTNHELHKSTRPDSDQEGALEMRAWEACRKVRKGEWGDIGGRGNYDRIAASLPHLFTFCSPPSLIFSRT
jgi:hypothetical protein